MGSSCGFARVSCGFVGASDGWRDVMEHFGMEWEFGSATGGNLALIGQINLEAAREDGAREFTVAIGIGEGHHTALQKTVSAMAMPFEQNRERFIEQWRRAANPEWLAAKAGDGGKLMRASHNVLLAHEDKTYSGAFGPATWCRPPRRCWPAGARRRRGAPWSTLPAPSSPTVALHRTSG
jgi:glucoamylase